MRWPAAVGLTKGLLAIAIISILLVVRVSVADPEQDRLAFIAFYTERFPDIEIAEYANGIYAIDSGAREQWRAIEEFPPYEFVVDEGASLWREVFSDGKTYADCFSVKTEDIRPLYPLFAGGTVITLEVAVNQCRLAHEQPAYAYDSEEISAITAFLAFASRGKQLDIRVPHDDAPALAAYESGKEFYYSKRGQLNFACSDCHAISVGQYARADRLSAGLGHATHFPVYRSKTGGMVSLHQRFSGCIRDVRARQFELQSIEYRNLEYFLTYMSNGFEINGPGARK